MLKNLVIVNKIGFILSAAILALVAMAYQPVSTIISTSSNSCKVSGSARITVKGTGGKMFAGYNPRTMGPINTAIPAGQYNVYWQSYDDHAAQGNPYQGEEQWYIEGRTNGKITWISTATPDLSDKVDTQKGLLQAKVNIPSKIDSVTFRHASDNKGPESVTPVCASFERTTPPSTPTACNLPTNDGRVVNSSNSVLLANSNRQIGPFNINLSAGTYDIKWQSYDDHSGHGGQNQYKEIWKAVYLKGGVEVGSSAATSDIPENQDIASGTLANQTVPMADQVIFRHAASASSGPQSVIPTCVSFDKHPEPVVVCNNLVATKINRDTFKFVTTAAAKNGASITNYTINFGDGTSTKGNGTANHTYSAPGTYTATVTVHGSTGNITSTYCRTTVKVNAPDPVVDLDLKKYVSVNGSTPVDANSASSAPSAHVGDTIRWSIVVRNNGPDTATGITVKDVVPAAFNLGNTSTTIGSVSGSIWAIGSLNAGSSATLFITTTASETGNFVNWAEIATHNENDSDSIPGDGADGQGPNKGSDGTKEDDEDPAHIKITTKPPTTASLGDRVWNDTNGNGIQDDGEPGIANLVVILIDKDGNEVKRTKTDAQGKYLFDNLAPGEYKVTFTKPAGFDFTTANQGGSDAKDSDANTRNGMTQYITLNAGDNIRTVDAGIVVKPQLSALGNRVWIDANKNGLQDSGEANLPGVRVELLDASGNVVATQFTNSNGEYLFVNLAPGAYSVKFNLPAGYNLTSQNSGTDDSKDSDANVATGVTAQVTLAAGETNLTVDAGVVPVPKPVFTCDSITVTSTGFRKYKATAKFTVKKTEVQKYIFTIFDEAGVRTVTTTNPEFDFEVTQPGNVVITAQVKTTDGTSDIRECQKTVVVDSLIDLELKKLVEFGGSDVVDANDESSAPNGTVGSDAQWTINLTNQGPDKATGVEVSDLIPEGLKYVTHATATGNFNPATAVWNSIEVEAGETVTLMIVTTVEKEGVITNWAGVTDADQEDKDSTPTDEIDGNEDDEDPAVIVSEKPETSSLGDIVWIDLNGNGVQDANEPGVDNVVVILTDAEGNEIARQTTTGGGKYLFDNLAPGDYKVTFELPNGYTFTNPNIGDDAKDSDADQTTGMTGVITLGTGENNLTVDAGLVPVVTSNPVARCVALNVVKLGDRNFRFEIVTLTKDASATNYAFSVNGKKVKSGDQQTMTFEATKAGSYTISASVEFDIDGESRTIDCPETVIDIREEGVVLGQSTPTPVPTVLPNTGPSSLIGAAGLSLAAFAVHAWVVSRRVLSSTL